MKLISLNIVAATSLALAALSYALYFDHQRRNDPNFRKLLKTQRAKAKKADKLALKSRQEQMVQVLKRVLDMVKNDTYPTSVEDRERYFMDNLQKGELLSKEGPEKSEESAACFFRALKVYPNPVELLAILQKSVPEDVIGLVYGMVSTEERAQHLRYFATLSQKFTNIHIRLIDAPSDVFDSKFVLPSTPPSVQKVVRRGVVSRGKIRKGVVILREEPVVACLYPETQRLKSRCDHCLRVLLAHQVEDPDAELSCQECHDVFFCSEQCLREGMNQYHQIVCPSSSTPTSAADSASFHTSNPLSSSNVDARALNDYCNARNLAYPLLIAKFVSKMIYKQTMMQSAKSSQQTVVPCSEWEDLEMCRPLVMDSVRDENTEKEVLLVQNVLKAIIPSVDIFLTVDRYLMLKASMMGSCYGIPPKPTNKSEISSTDADASTDFPQEHRPRHHFSKLIGVGLYFVSSHLNHSCDANTIVHFDFPPSDRNSQVIAPRLMLIALRDISEGEELFVKYFPVLEGDETNCRTAPLKLWNAECECSLCKPLKKLQTSNAELPKSSVNAKAMLRQESAAHGHEE